MVSVKKNHQHNKSKKLIEIILFMANQQFVQNKKQNLYLVGGFNGKKTPGGKSSKRVYDFGSLPGAPTRGGAAVFNHLAMSQGCSVETVRPWEPFFSPKGWFKWWCFFKSKKMQKSDNEIEYVFTYIYIYVNISTHTPGQQSFTNHLQTKGTWPPGFPPTPLEN